MGYMAMMDCAKGVLWYYILTRKQDDGFWREFHISLNKADRQELRAQLLDDAMRLEGAINAKNPDLARNVAADPDYEWKCRTYCDYAEKCDQGWPIAKAWREGRGKSSYKLIEQLKESVKQTNKLTKPTR